MTRSRRRTRRNKASLMQRTLRPLREALQRRIPRGKNRRTRQDGPLSILLARIRTKMAQQRESKGSFWWVPLGSLTLIVVGGLTLMITLPASVNQAGDYLLRGQRFQLSSVEIRGNHRVSSSALVEALAVAKGTPLVDLDLDALKSKLEAGPEILRVNIMRLPPSRLLVSVEEVWPQAWTQVGKSKTRTLIDYEGRPYAQALPMDKYTLPSISGAENVKLGEPNLRLREAIALANTLARTDLPDVRSIRALRDTEIPGYAVVFRNSQQQFLFGRDAFEETIARLNQVRDAAPKELAMALEIDLRFRNQVVLRGVPTLKKAGKSGGHAWIRGAVHHKTFEETQG